MKKSVSLFLVLFFTTLTLSAGNLNDSSKASSNASEYTPGNYSSPVPSQCGDVMIQAFYWDSYQSTGKYGTTKWGTLNQQASELAGYFDLVWIAPSAKSSGGTGYHPSQWCNQTSAHGSQSELQTLIANLHAGGAKVIADIVVNHKDNKSTWCDFWPEDFGTYGHYNFTASHICKDDEVNTSSTAGACQGTATGAYDTGEKYAAARDLDHTNTYVQDGVKAYLKWLKYEMKYDGWRFDVAKGFSPSYFGTYASDAQSYFSVGEYLDGSYDLLNAWVNGTGKKSTAFDFSLKFNGLNNGLAKGDLTKLVWMNQSLGKNQPAGMIHSDLRKYAVTLVDNHDTFERANGNDFASITSKDLILQANAFILSSPGIPCVYYPHWVRYKSDIQKMVLARKAVGVHSESAVTVNDTGTDKYVATATGTNGTLMVKIGAGSGSSTTPTGYTKAASGTNWAMYTKTTTNPTPKLIITPAGGTYTSNVSVSMEALNGGIIYYTTNGTTPTTSSSTYSAPIQLTQTTTLKAFVKSGTVQTAVHTEEYTIKAAQTTPITVAFYKPADWTKVNLYAWGTDATGTKYTGVWPGTAMTTVVNGWYKHTFDASIKEVNFIFNNGTSQTSDLYTNEDVCYSWTGVTEKLEEGCDITPIKHIVNNQAITIYPNPAENTLYITTEGAMKNIEIFSAMGALISRIERNMTSQTIDVSTVQSGIYFIRIMLDNGSFATSKFIKK
ncbi:MAG: starch-binding protein [Paludibacteraceae bacterium]|nr:starch-binding protein [Paludibacteraceae bacterium]